METFRDLSPLLNPKAIAVVGTSWYCQEEKGYEQLTPW